MNGELSGLNWGTLATIYASLLLFGIAYNALTAWAERSGFIKGYTALFVVGGVLVTLAATAAVSLPFALIATGAFVASGTPMVIGSMVRHARERQQEIERLRDEARHGDAL